MIVLSRRVLQRSGDVFAFEVRIILKNFFTRRTRGKQSKHVHHPNAHAANARATATLLRVVCDAVE